MPNYSNPPDTDFIERLTAFGREVDAYRERIHLSPAGWEGQFNRLANEMVELLRTVGPKALYLYSNRLIGGTKKNGYNGVVQWIGNADPYPEHVTRVEEWFATPYQEILAAYDIALVTNKMKKKRASPYLETVLRWIANNSIRIPEDVEASYDILKEYHDLKAAGRLNKNEQDINQYEYQQDLAAMVLKKTGRGKRLNTKGVTQWGESDDFKEDPIARMYQIDTYKQMVQVGSNTNWCVVGNEEYFDKYGPPFYLLTVEDEGGERRVSLVHLPTLSIKNEPDIPNGVEVLDGAHGDNAGALLYRLFEHFDMWWAMNKGLGDLGDHGDWVEALDEIEDKINYAENIDGSEIREQFSWSFVQAIEHAFDPDIDEEDISALEANHAAMEQALQDVLDHDIGVEGTVEVSDEGYYLGGIPPWEVWIDDIDLWRHINAHGVVTTFRKAYAVWEDQSNSEQKRVDALEKIYKALVKIDSQITGHAGDGVIDNLTDVSDIQSAIDDIINP